MNIATLQGETTVEALALRLYGKAAKQRPELVEHLRDANPHLKDLASLPQGTPVLVPRSGDAQIDAQTPAADPRRQAAIADVSAAIDDLQKQGNAVLTLREETLRESGAIAELQPLRDAGGETFAGELNAIVAGVKAQLAQTTLERAALKDLLAKARTLVHPPRRRPSGK